MEFIFSIISISGWAVVFLFIVIALIVAWRLFSYTNLGETSPYLVGLEHDEDESVVNDHDDQED